MKKIIFTGASFLLLSAGVALAGQPQWGGNDGGHGQHGQSSPSVKTTVPIVKNAISNGSGTNSSATTGSTAISASLSNSANSTNSDNTAVFKVIGSNYAVGGSSLSTTNTHTHIDMKLATAVSNGEVSDNKVINKPCLSQSYGGATMSSVNGGTGILSAQQNTGANALQQTTVALGSSIQGSNNMIP